MKVVHAGHVAARMADVPGEGPVCGAADGSRALGDIGRSLWHRLDLVTGEVTAVAVEPALTGFAPTGGQDYIGAFTSGLVMVDRQDVVCTGAINPSATCPTTDLTTRAPID